MDEQIKYIGLDLAFHNKEKQYVENTLANVASTGRFDDLVQKPFIPNITVEEERLIIT